MRRPEVLVAGPGHRAIETGALLRRRRLAVAVTLVIGTGLLAATLRVPDGSARFSVLSALTAAAWVVGALASGPIPVRPPMPSPWRVALLAAAAGGVAFVGFLVAHAVGQRLPVVSGALDRVLATADAGPVALVLVIALVNGVAEELFFRGAVYAALEPRRPALTSTLVYVAATAATANVALIVAAAIMGALLSLERRSTRSVLAPIVTHLTWSTLIVLVLPR